MNTEIIVNNDIIEINVTEEIIIIEAPSGAYPLPSGVYSVFGRTGNVIAQDGDYNLTQLGDVTITNASTGQVLRYDGTSWVNSTESYVGTVTSVAASVPTGLTISGSPITTSGTLAFGLDTGYVIPLESTLDAKALKATSISTTAPLTGGGDLSANRTFAIAKATTSVDGYLAATDFTTFNNKQNALSGSGIVKSTSGTITYLTDNTANWDTAYNRSLTSASVTGTTTKTLTLNEQGGGTITASWTDINTDAVSSVFGRTGAVVAQSGDYTTTQVTEGTNLYFTDARARGAVSFTAGSGAYNSTTGVFTIPTNTNQLTNGASFITLTSLSASSPLSYSNTTGAFSISQANTSTNGYLSSFDWNTFNSKQTALTLGNLTSSDITVTGGTGAVVGSGATMTLATVNTNVGAYGDSTHVPTITVNAKGLVTAASQTAIPTATNSVTGLLTYADWSTFNGKQNQLNGTGFVKASGTTITYDNSTYLTTIEGITAGGELSGTYASPSLVNSAVTGKVLTGVNITGGTIVSTDSILTAFGKVQNQINGLIGGSIYQGTWNANTNTPTLTSSVGTSGYYYIVSVAGTTNLNGITDWQVGDWAIFNGGVWQKVDNTDAVVSVNGFTGAVSLTTSDISEGSNLYFTNARTIASTLTGYTSGAGTITSSDTILTAIQKLNGNIGSIVSGVSSVFGRTGAVVSGIGDYTTSQVTEGTNLYFTDTRARAAISLTTTGTSGAATYVSGVLNIPNYGSALTGYVPYTGATSDVNLGLFDLKTAKLWLYDVPNAGYGSLELTDGVLHFEDADGHSMVTMEDGYLTIANASTIRALLNVSGLSANRDYAFPNASGTLALTSDISYPVTSVFGRTGAVVATSGDYTTTQVTEGTNLYYTDTRARASLSFVAGSGAYNSTTGVITIPTNNTQITNGSNYITLASLSATSPLSYNNTTGAFTIAQATTSTNGYLSSTDWNTFNSKGSGTVTSVAALTLGTTGTDVSSSVATSTTTPVITLNIPTASATNRGALSSTDWTTFNNKQAALTNPVTLSGSITTNYLTKWTGTNTIGNSLIWDNGTNVGIGNQGTTYTLDVSGTLRNTTSAYFATSSGSVGIGTTNTNNVKLEVSATTIGGAEYSAFTTNQDGGVSSKYSFWRTYGGGSTAFRAGYVANYNQDDSNSSANDQRLVFATKSGTAEPTTKMTITGAGNVGIGGTPSYKLDVLGSSGVIAKFSDGTTNSFIYSGSNSSAFGSDATIQNGIIMNGASSTAQINTSGQTRLLITSGGNVNINGSGFSDVKFYVKGSDATSSNYAALFVNGSASNLFNIRNDGAVQVFGSLSKGSGSFRIEHPLESLSETHQLVHSFIEGPKADLIYRGKLTLVNGKAQANIDEVSTMTEGTFEALCREVQCFTTNESGWDLIKGKVVGNIIYIESQNTNSIDEISWMVIGERKDKHIMDTDWTDENGKVIVEPLKPIEPTMPSQPTI